MNFTILIFYQIKYLSYKKTPKQIAKRPASATACMATVTSFSASSTATRNACALIANDTLRAHYAPTSNYNFIAFWVHIKKHQPYAFYISKEFYEYAKENKNENISRKMYDTWSV